MKKNRIRKFLLLASFFTLLFTVHSSFSQKHKTKIVTVKLDVRKMLENKSFVFVPQSLSPTSGRSRQITSYYEVIVSKDSIICDLPYFGRALEPPIDPSDIGFTFTSTKFDYELKDAKKNSFDVKIKINDKLDARQLIFSVFDNGSTTLSINSNAKQPITYEGYIKERK